MLVPLLALGVIENAAGAPFLVKLAEVARSDLGLNAAVLVVPPPRLWRPRVSTIRASSSW
ncbi:hypothetical protein ACWGRK_10145 [Saccharomonospora azurea]